MEMFALIIILQGGNVSVESVTVVDRIPTAEACWAAVGRFKDAGLRGFATCVRKDPDPPCFIQIPEKIEKGK